MDEKPILFSGPMVNSILAGKKTQTRRIAKQYPQNLDRHPYGRVPGRLWVREAWGCHFDYDNVMPSRLRDLDPVPAITYRADHIDETPEHIQRWRPSIFMPRWVSRIVLTVVDVRVERVQEITEADALLEGIYNSNPGGAPQFTIEGDPVPFAATAVECFESFWEFLHGARDLKTQWVWVVTFKIKEQP